ncbi:MAG: hypothetical protein ACQETV_00685 [Actinomycetota bacterium]
MPAALVLLLALVATTAPGPAALAEEDETVVGPAATELSIERRVEGEAPAGARFAVALACGGLDRVELAVGAGEVRSLPVPQGEDCELVEVDDGGAASVTIAVDEGTRAEGGAVAFSTGERAELSVVVTSHFEPDPTGPGDEAATGERDVGDGQAERPSTTGAAEEGTEVLDEAIPTPSRVDTGGGALASPPAPSAPWAALLVVAAGLAALAVAARRRHGGGA